MVIKEESKLFIIMEYCAGGDIAQLIRKCKLNQEQINENTIWKILWQVISALSQCHYRKEGKIMHRDIKPGNIFLDDQKNVKLGDFGLS